MQKVLVVKNIAREGPGLFQEILSERGLGYEIRDLDAGDKFPDPAGYSAVAVFGGPDSANDDTDKMKTELARIKETVQSGIPYIGVCLGMQTLVKSQGGEVYRNPVREIGWRDPEGNYFEVCAVNKDPIFQDMNTKYKIFHLHGETVKLPSSMELLGRGKWCENQVVRVKGKPAYGIQGHLELTPQMLEDWIAQDPDLVAMDTAKLRKDYSGVKKEYEKAGRQMLTNFLSIARLI
ncbi:MAG: type 1 glutamine amidotransferase [Candidatus Aenigmarchaeota archaeon]|nr:type 1 glutamine amidotransferase [Candidatus Aenigmarchaeota archaeon]